jgi:hypothetical protein
MYFQLYFVLLYIFPLLFIAFLIYLNSKNNHVYSLLTHNIKSPYEINFNKFERVRDPYINIDKINQPKFLQEEFKKTYFLD